MQGKTRTILLMLLAFGAGRYTQTTPAAAAKDPQPVMGVPLDDASFMKKLLTIEWKVGKVAERLDDHGEHVDQRLDATLRLVEARERPLLEDVRLP